MRPKRRVLSIAKQACIVATAGLVLALALSGWFGLERAWLTTTSAGCVGVGEGGAFIMDYTGPNHGHFDTRVVRRKRPNWAWWIQFQWGPPPGAPYTARVFFVPLWVPILAGRPPPGAGPLRPLRLRPSRPAVRIALPRMRRGANPAGVMRAGSPPTLPPRKSGAWKGS